MFKGIRIDDLTKAEVLAALHNAAKQQSQRFAAVSEPSDLTIEEARKLLSRTQFFDKLHGRELMISLENNDGWFIGTFYDRANGEGLAQQVIDELRLKRGLLPVMSQGAHVVLP